MVCDFTALLLGVLGHDSAEFTSLLYDTGDGVQPDCSLPFLNWHSCAAKKRPDQAGAFLL